MIHKLKTETISQKIDYSGGFILFIFIYFFFFLFLFIFLFFFFFFFAPDPVI